jgi:hypothetical protein
MQTTLPQLPEVGKTYTSQEDPTLSIFVEAVETIEADENNPAGFYVEGCDPKDKGNASATVYEVLDDEWVSFRFVQVAE